MGYCIENRGNDFEMDMSLANDALKSLKALFSQADFAPRWASTETILEAKTFEDALSEAGFDLLDDGKLYYQIWFNGEKYGGDEIKILSAIAPYVTPGSYIEMGGEDGEIWRWVFDGDTVIEKYPRIIWD